MKFSGGWVGKGAEGVVLQEAALSILYIVPNITSRGLRYVQPVNYSNVHSRHWGRCNDVATEFISLTYMNYTL